MGRLGVGLAVLALVVLPATAVFAQGKGGGNGGGGGGGGGGKDRNPPVVSVTSPAEGATVSGAVTVSADATDDVGVASVEFSVDGGAAVAMANSSGSAWSASWDSASVSDGAHTITVTARDAKGNAASDSVNVTTDNGTAPPGPVWPDSMAAIGDSITRGVFADGSLDGLDFGQPQHSWATGDESGDGVDSHFERILANNGAILNNNFNNADSGARMDDFLTMANITVPQAPDYIVVFLGHNDLCRSSVASIPSDAKFEGHARNGLDTLLAGVPDATIVIMEILDVAALWDCCSSNYGCRFNWSLFGICESVTNSSSTDRALVRQRTIAFNDILRSLAAEKGVLFEDDLFEVGFARSDLSSVDCFHPSFSGQSKIANGSFKESRF